MNWKKIAPWNWLRKEGEVAAHAAETGLHPADPLAGIRGQMDRLFEDALRRLGDGESGGALLRPHLDISEGKAGYKIEVEIPGVDRQDVTVALEGDTLVIRGEKRHEREESDEQVHCVERSYGAFERLLSLPEDADADRIEASFRRGVLKLRIPRRAGSQPATRRVEIQAD